MAPASGPSGPCLSDGRPVGSRDPSFQVSADHTCCCIVAPVDVLTVPNELGLEGRSHVTLIVRRRHTVPLAHSPCVNHPGVLPGEDLLGDAPERTLGMHDYVAVARGVRGAVLRMRYSVVGHFRRGRTGRKGLNRGRRLRAGSKQSTGSGGKKDWTNCFLHLWVLLSVGRA